MTRNTAQRGGGGGRYIVACPRAACPFDEATQAAPYPASHTADMAALGFELQAGGGGARPLFLTSAVFDHYLTGTFRPPFDPSLFEQYCWATF